ncbi:MAG: xanthine dehydrogenase family protein molybdopterin-binding subunit [Oscillospiraceae bacterium]|nr:xanthine dehydrogenase family protein molybdopterin-binding subunit [Oscillospiraceae bacterium]
MAELQSKHTQYRYVGKYTPRKDARDIVTGRCMFLDDYKGSGELFVKILTSSRAHATITKLDVSKAEALPGVVKIITPENIPEWARSWLLGLPPIKPIVDSHVRYVGDSIAVIAAESEEICKEAIRLIEVEYDHIPAVFDIWEAGKDGAPQLYPERCINNRFEDQIYLGEELLLLHCKRGDVDKAFEECDVIDGGVGSFETFPSPLAPEPPGMVSTYLPVEDKYVITATCQSPHILAMASDTGHMPGVVIDVKAFNVGGSYGNKQSMTPLVLYSCMMARLTGRPCRFFMDKEEQLLIHEMRIGSRMDVKFGMKDGKVHAVKGKWYVNQGFCDDAGYCITAVGLGEMQLALGKCQNWDVETHMYATNRIVSGIVRGFGGQELKASMMPLVCRTMAANGIDPIQFYHDNFVSPGDRYIWRDSKWYTTHEVDYRKTILDSAEKFGWKNKWKGWYVPTRIEGSKAYGVGASVHGNADVGEDNAEAMVRIRFNGQVTLQTALTESGMGQKSNMAKIVAEELNIPYEKVSLSTGGTIDGPDDFGLAGSCGTLTSATAAQRAAEDARRQLLALAVPILRVSPDQLDTRDGFIFPKNKPETGIPWMAVIRYCTDIIGHGAWRANYSQPNFCMNMVEVSVDLETGEARLERILTGTDVGQIIDSRDLAMQLHGGIGTAAIDSGLFEESIIDEYTGRLMTGNLIDYKWRTFNDFPPFDLLVNESHPNISKYHAVGIGEISGAPGAAAIMMAISNAIGKEFVHYPATPASILEALGKA